MKRTQLNFAIDLAAFAAFLCLLSTGLLLQFQLPPGSGGLGGRGGGHAAAEREVSLLWGWTRHEWGQVHYWIAGVLVAILATHVLLHWKWIVCVVRGTHGDASGIRFGVGAASLVALVFLVAVPLLAPTVRLKRGELQAQRGGSQDDASPRTAELRGSMTVAEVAESMHLSVPNLLQKLGLPTNVDANERIGRLLRQHNLQMSDLRQIIQADQTNGHTEAER